MTRHPDIDAAIDPPLHDAGGETKQIEIALRLVVQGQRGEGSPWRRGKALVNKIVIVGGEERLHIVGGGGNHGRRNTQTAHGRTRQLQGLAAGRQIGGQRIDDAIAERMDSSLQQRQTIVPDDLPKLLVGHVV